MLHLTRWILLPAILIGWLAAPQFAAAQGKVRQPRPTRTVQDDGDFFSNKAKEKANQEIAEIKKKFDKDLLIETFAKAPESIKKINLKDSKEKNEFFKEWAEKRAKNADVRGVYVLICKEPSYLEPSLANNEKASGVLKGEEGREVGKILVDNAKAKENDEALLEAVAFVDKTLQEHAGRWERTTNPGSHAPVATTHAGEGVRNVNWMGY